ncbi:MAG: twin-arginine translocase TatA/TatE family subunit [Bdellovibrionales bacterium]|nr:twin-arginine translocase TatA/TatE family subunit [Bdellovibrionales bacterium]
MFGISFEHLLIVGVILLIVGPRKLPELGNTMGKAIKNFKDSFSGIEEASFKRILENPKPEQPKPAQAESTVASGPAETLDRNPPAPPAV